MSNTVGTRETEETVGETYLATHIYKLLGGGKTSTELSGENVPVVLECDYLATLDAVRFNENCLKFNISNLHEALVEIVGLLGEGEDRMPARILSFIVKARRLLERTK